MTIKDITAMIAILILVEKSVQRSCPLNCQECDKTGSRCLKCSSNYGLTSNYCFRCKINNCLDCSGNPDKCVNCSPFYHYDEFKQRCSFCGYGCEDCSSKENCLNCAFLFKFDNKGGKNCKFNFSLFCVVVAILLGPCVVVWIFGCWILTGRKSYKVFSVGGVEVIENRTERRVFKDDRME